MKLLNELKSFHECLHEEDLLPLFSRIADILLYGGYIKVRDDYRVYIKTVEFYYHSEKTEGVHDPIVYHRNGKDQKIVPYFPLMTLNAHSSGFDITFENEQQQYRASALIRAYEVMTADGKYLKWEKVDKENSMLKVDKEKSMFKVDKEKSMFTVHNDYQFNKQSTYLYSLLNGFAMSGESDIVWVDNQRTVGKPIIGVRQNVFKSINANEYEPFEKDEYDKYIRCKRPWSFARTEKV